MKRIFLFVIVLISTRNAGAQNGITANGAYVWTLENKGARYPLQTGETLLIQSTSGNWKMQIQGGANPEFSAGGKNIFYMAGDTLHRLILGTSREISIPGVSRYQAYSAGKKNWLFIGKKDAGNFLLQKDFDKKEMSFSGIEHYYFNPQGTMLVLVSKQDDERVVRMMDVLSGDIRDIWKGEGDIADQPVFDQKSKQMVLLLSKGSGANTTHSILYYQTGQDKARTILNDGDAQFSSELGIADEPQLTNDLMQKVLFSFTEDGRHLLFYLRQKAPAVKDRGPHAVTVWSYQDPILQSLQRKDAGLLKYYLAVLSIEDGRMQRLQGDKDIPDNYSQKLQFNNDFILMVQPNGNALTYDGFNQFNSKKLFVPPSTIHRAYSFNEYNWNKMTAVSAYFVSLKDGSREPLFENIPSSTDDIPPITLSPEGKYVVYYDCRENEYCSYEIATGALHRLQANTADFLARDDQEALRDYSAPPSREEWLPDDRTFFVKDSYGDIWQLDPSGEKAAYNITHGYARKNHLQFSIDTHLTKLDVEKTLYLNVSTERVYDNPGLYKLDISGNKSPVVLIKEAGEFNYNLTKAKNNNICLIKRWSGSVPPCDFVTTDFEHYRPVTSTFPDQRVGIRKELITWKTADGKDCAGVLRFPRNFDKNKKYPVIVYYYEKSSQEINSFDIMPADGDFTWFGDGYFKFSPDIVYEIGATGPSVIGSVVPGVKKIATLPYIDAKRIGILGGSFGGYETNMLATVPNLFAAAISIAGMSDFISYYGIEDKDDQGYNYAAGAEIGQSRLGATPWERPDIYLKSSPFFYADRVTTPILISHNRGDDRVPFAQSIEFFKALRRLGKKSMVVRR